MPKAKRLASADLGTLVAKLDDDLNDVLDMTERTSHGIDAEPTLEQVSVINRYAAALGALNTRLLGHIRTEADRAKLLVRLRAEREQSAQARPLDLPFSEPFSGS